MERGAEQSGTGVELTVTRFNPDRMDDAIWARVGPLVRRAVTTTEPRDARDARELLTRVAHLAHWCFTRAVPLELAVILAPATFDRFVLEGCAHLKPGSRANYRAVLRRVGAANLGPLVWPHREPLSLSPRLTPYSYQDVSALVGWTRGLATARMRGEAQVLLGLGLGAGLTSAEIALARANWIVREPSGLVVSVTGNRARRVPLDDAWAWAVAPIEGDSDRPVFLPDRAKLETKQVSRFVEQLPRGDAPKLSVQRLRATWIVRMLDRHVPLNVLSDASGVGAEHLAQYARFMRAVDPSEAERLLRGDPA